MVVTQVSEHEAIAEPQKPSRLARLPGAAWTNESQLWRTLPIIRLLTSISAIPEVDRVGVYLDGAGMIVHVFVSNEDRKATSAIFEAERDYLNSTSEHAFDLRLTSLRRVPESIKAEILSGLEIVFKR